MIHAGLHESSLKELLESYNAVSQIVGQRQFSIHVEHIVYEYESSSSDVAGFEFDIQTNSFKIYPELLAAKNYSQEELLYGLVLESLCLTRDHLLRDTDKERFTYFTSIDRATNNFYHSLNRLAASNKIHALLPAWRFVGKHYYKKFLYSETNYLDVLPAHEQFLAKISRDQMLKPEKTIVEKQVYGVVKEFSNFLGTGLNLIDYSTKYAKDKSVEMSVSEQFTIWSRNIYPIWLTLLDTKLQKPEYSQTRKTSHHGTSTLRQILLKDTKTEPATDNKKNRNNPNTNGDSAQANSQKIKGGLSGGVGRGSLENKPDISQSALKEEEKRYLNEIKKYQSEILEIKDAFRSHLDEQAHLEKYLQHSLSEGMFLSPESLSQAVIDIKTQNVEPRIFSNFLKRNKILKNVNSADYFFVFDRSGSMMGEKSAAAASTAILLLEAFTIFENQFEEIKENYRLTLNVELRSAVYTFNDKISVPKPLSTTLSAAERLNTLSQIRNPSGGNADSIILQNFIDMDKSGILNPRKVLVMIADGKADDAQAAKKSITTLRNLGWKVFGISIGSSEAVKLYHPNSFRVDTPRDLPLIALQLLEKDLQNAF